MSKVKIPTRFVSDVKKYKHIKWPTVPAKKYFSVSGEN